jgi:hypothetical protein
LVPRRRGTFVSAIVQLTWLVGILLVSAAASYAGETHSGVVCRDNIAADHRRDLAAKLQKITGWPELKFDSQGMLRSGTGRPNGGSRSARDLLTKILWGDNVVVLEDVSRSSAVAFAQVIPGRFRNASPESPPAFVVQIDFADFEHVLGDKRALEAFDLGWALLHEFDHIVNASEDSTLLAETGECEEHINRMRRECGLPVRADYFFTFLPIVTDSAFMNRLVRLPFEQELTRGGKKKRYWVIWDANLVGGIEQLKQIASLR